MHSHQTLLDPNWVVFFFRQKTSLVNGCSKHECHFSLAGLA
jgi:hypothetical protein